MMKKDVVLMSGNEMMKADVVMLNGFVNKCAPVWSPVFKNEFERKGFNILEYSKEMDTTMNDLRYIMTTKKLDGYDIEQEINDFINKEDLTQYESENLLKGCMYLMCMQQLIMESVLNKTKDDNLYNEMYMFNLIKGFIYSMKDLEMNQVLDLSFIEIPDALKLTIDALLSDEDRKYVRF